MSSSSTCKQARVADGDAKETESEALAYVLQMHRNALARVLIQVETIRANAERAHETLRDGEEKAHQAVREFFASCRTSVKETEDTEIQHCEQTAVFLESMLDGVVDAAASESGAATARPLAQSLADAHPGWIARMLRSVQDRNPAMRLQCETLKGYGTSQNLMQLVLEGGSGGGAKDVQEGVFERVALALRSNLRFRLGRGCCIADRSYTVDWNMQFLRLRFECEAFEESDDVLHAMCRRYRVRAIARAHCPTPAQAAMFDHIKTATQASDLEPHEQAALYALLHGPRSVECVLQIECSLQEIGSLVARFPSQTPENKTAPFLRVMFLVEGEKETDRKYFLRSARV
jgi:hypothetical protein